MTRPCFRDELTQAFLPLAGQDPSSVLAVGLGRSYGDTCLNSKGRLIDMTGLDRFIRFDPEGGTLRAEAGLSLSALLPWIVPKGFFLPTTPGTGYVTLGGAVANDVHGKNHHAAGTFGCSVTGLGLMRSDGTRYALSPTDGRELFEATIGGLGLTGLIEWVEFKLRAISSAYLDVETVAFGNLDEFFALSQESATTWEHTVSWVDCFASGNALGRGVFFRGRHRDDRNLAVCKSKTTLSLPIDLPSFALNKWSLRAFNTLFHKYKKRCSGLARVHYAPFFYPLDTIRQWNRLYGSRGLYQYQCVVPPTSAGPAIKELLREIARSGQGSFLAVLKTFGSRKSPGLLSFPREGTTLALDFANRGDETLRLLSRLDKVVAEAKGRLYPAKDGRMPAQMFRRGYPNWTAFANHVDPMVSSDFWRRVCG